MEVMGRARSLRPKTQLMLSHVLYGLCERRMRSWYCAPPLAHRLATYPTGEPWHMGLHPQVFSLLALKTLCIFGICG